MNFLVILQEEIANLELVEDGTFFGKVHIHSTFRIRELKDHFLDESSSSRTFRAGQVLKAVVIGLGQAEAVLEECSIDTTNQCNSPEFLRITISGSIQKNEDLQGRFVVGLTRPLALKRIIHAAATWGTSDLRLYVGELSPKSYSQSKVLEQIETIQRKALAQCGRTYVGTVNLYSSLASATSDIDSLLVYDTHKNNPKISDTHKINLDLVDHNNENQSASAPAVYHLLGGARGFSALERDMYKKKQVDIITLGAHVYRTEDMFVALASKFVV